MEEDGPVPDHLRCNRTDGRQWRCKKRVKDNLKLCETHYLQGRHRQNKQKVPESLKMQRSNGISAASRRSVKIRATKVEIVAKLMKKRKKQRSSEGFRKRTKRGNTELELIRMVLKREVEKSNGKSLREREISCDDDSEEELTRDLPNGLMAISSNSLSTSQGNANAGSDLPLGVKVGAISGPVTMMRRFRSKNVEALPIDKWQVLPSSQTGAKLSRDKRKKCHWCRRSGSQILAKCSSCQKQFFCLDCIKERYFNTPDEVKEACPVCRRTCTCKDCFRNSYTDTESKDFLGEKHNVEVILCVHYLICMLLPVLKQINVNQNDELEIEARIKGKIPNDLEIKQAVIGCDDQHCCNKCKGHILDLHRSCPNCSYNLCLSCCRDLHHEGLHEGIDMPRSVSLNKTKNGVLGSTRRMEENPKRTKRNPSNKYVSSTVSLARWKAHNADGETSCPPMNFGGCGESLLELRCLFPSSWTRELEARAEQIVCSYDCPDTSDIDSCCSLCHGTNHRAEAAVRKGATDNFLYHPTLVEIHSDNVEHFQKHWLKGHPVIVRNVLKATLDLSWDPVLMFCTYLEQSISRRENNGGICESSTCLDWCQVEIGMRQCFMGSLNGETRKNTWNETLKLKGWLSSELFKQQFPDHYAEIIHTLPLQEYMNPASGLLNLAARLPQGIIKPDLGPCLYISYGYAEQLVQADSVIKLHYDSYDIVNVLAHTSDVPISDEQVSKVRKLLKKHKAQKQNSSSKADQNLVNEVERKAVLSDGKIRASGSPDRIGEEMHFRKKVAGVSCSSITTHGSYERNHLRRKTLDVKSDSETDSDSEGLLARRRSNGSVTSEGGKSNGKHSQASSCTAQWDIFRRQDVPKLSEYLKRHSNEFTSPPGFHDKVVHPILDQSFFLDAYHKMRLKQEYKIEPWSFQQRVGEAVVIPAGCPYQIRSPKSCVHVVLDFLSPENVTECVQLTDEIRQLPTGHKAKLDAFEVKRIALHSLSEAVKKIRELTCATAT